MSTHEKKYLDGSYAVDSPDWHESDAVWKAQQVVRILRDHGIAPGRLADVGCGTGGVLDAIQTSFPGTEVVGYEISPQAVELARQRHPLVPVVEGTVPAGQKVADVLLLLDVFEHVEDYFGFLRSLIGSAEHYVFHVPLDMNALAVARTGSIAWGRSKVGHLHYFSSYTALSTLRDSGFRIVAHRYTATAIDLPGRPWKMKAARIPRRLLFSAAPDWTARVIGGYSLIVLAVQA